MMKLEKWYIVNIFMKTYMYICVNRINSVMQYAHRFFHLGVHVPFYLHFWGYIQIFGGAMYPLTLHLGVQRKWTVFSPHKVMQVAVFLQIFRPKKKIMCVYCHMSKKSRVGRSGLIYFFLLSAKPEIVVPGSGIWFRYFIFEIFGKMTNYAVFLPSLLSISTKS